MPREAFYNGKTFSEALGQKERKTKLGILFTFWWQMWIERNRIIF
jgi:hypothetical protein